MPFFDPKDYDLAALNAAVAEGRCWDLAGTTDDGRRWIIGDEADAARVTPPAGSSHRRVPVGSFFVLERQARELRALQPRDDIEVDGRRWRAGEDWWVNRTRLHVEHPRLGWSDVDDADRLARIVSALATLPVEDGSPRRYRIEGRGRGASGQRWITTTSWDAARAIGDLVNPRVEVTERVSPVHVAATWAWWSDQKLTARPELHPPLVGLERAAVELITGVTARRSGAPKCGWRLLARVAEVRSREFVAEGSYVTHERLDRLRVVLTDGEERDLWERSGDRSYELRSELPDAWGVDPRGVLLPIGRDATEPPGTKACDECKSLYFAATSKMGSMCPERSHWIYGQPQLRAPVWRREALRPLLLERRSLSLRERPQGIREDDGSPTAMGILRRASRRFWS